MRRHSSKNHKHTCPKHQLMDHKKLKKRRENTIESWAVYALLYCLVVTLAFVISTFQKKKKIQINFLGDFTRIPNQFYKGLCPFRFSITFQFSATYQPAVVVYFLGISNTILVMAWRPICIVKMFIKLFSYLQQTKQDLRVDQLFNKYLRSSFNCVILCLAFSTIIASGMVWNSHTKKKKIEIPAHSHVTEI